MDVSLLLLVLVLVASAVTDLLDRKIYNAITYPAILVGLLLHAMAGWRPLADAAGGVALAVAVFYPLCRAGGMGLGDLKLMAVVGAMAGVAVVGASMVTSALLGGVFAMALTLRRGTAMATLRRAVRVPSVLAGSLRRKRPSRFAAPKRGDAIPYGVAIALGTGVVLAWHWPWG